MINGKVIVVTGGSGLLGSHFCSEIAKCGGVCIIVDINESSGNTLKNKIIDNFPLSNIEFFRADINSTESLKDLILKLDSKYGRIDAIINNAYPKNSNFGRTFFEVDYFDFCENINLNLGGYFLSCQLFAQYFKEQGFGNIINIASIYGVIAPRFQIYNDTSMTTPVEYAVIKSSLIHLTRYMAKYFKNLNIRVNAISLGGLEDGQPESFKKMYGDFCLNKGMLNPNDIIGTLLFLLSDSSKYINGQNIIVDDGFTL